LSTGASSLNTGADQLRDGLESGLADIPNADASTRADQASTIGDPVAVKTTNVASAGSYGAGLAPFFVSLSAWIGIYALFLIVKPLSRRALTALRSPGRVTLAGWLTPGLLGVVQMLALFAVLTIVLKLSINQPVAMIGFLAVTSLTFTAIILALNIWLGSVGQFLGLILMIVQLVTSGGTFPWQTLPGPLAALHHALPMSYAVDGIRQLMYGGSGLTALADAGYLAVWLLVGLAFSFLGARRMTKHRTLRDLRPSLIG
jgi:putative membrane protein